MKCLGMLMMLALAATWAGNGALAAPPSRGAAAYVAVPFAVPVAVPVAVVQRPAVLYRYTAPLPAPDNAAFESALQHTHAEPAAADLHRTAASAIFARHCAACHADAAGVGGLALFDESGALRARLPRRRVLEAVVPQGDAPARMPPAERLPLSADELHTLRRWAELPRELEY